MDCEQIRTTRLSRVFSLLAIGLVMGARMPAGFGALAFEWQSAGSYRYVELAVPAGGKAGFKPLHPSQTGILFTNLLAGDRGLTNQVLLNGSGVACGDVDGDGWCDLYFCGIDSANVLYRNLGNFKFQDISAGAGVECAGQPSTGAVFADVDGDGDLDMLVNGIGRGTRLFLNDGRGHFREGTAQAGLANRASSTSMALGDVDGDGDLDLYVCNYRAETIQDEPAVDFRVSVRDGVAKISLVRGKAPLPEELTRFQVNPMTMSIEENGEPDVLYLNDGQGKFTPVPWTQGAFLDEEGNALAAPPYDWSLAAMFRDMNGDGLPDLYVCGDNFSPDRIWLNRGQGRFQAMPRLALRHTSLSSMAVDFADLNRDGRDDFFVTDMLSREHSVRHRLLIDRHSLAPPGLVEDRPQFARNMLFLNRGDGSYAEIAQLSGLEASDWSWAPVCVDVDLDGYEDILITSGLLRSLRDADVRRQIDMAKASRTISKQELFELRKQMPVLNTPTFAYRNRGDLTFEDVSQAWGFDARQFSQAITLADLDNDGDLDVVINCLNGPPLIFRSESSAPRVAVRLAGEGLNRRGIGAKIELTGGPVTQSQEMICGGRYLGCDDTLRVFAAGQTKTGMNLQVHWRSGKVSSVTNVHANRLYEIVEPAASSRSAPASVAVPTPVFKDVSESLRHRHFASGCNDFERQPLLPKLLSRLGPGVSWFDFDGDGREDLFVGCGRGGELGVFFNQAAAGFKRINLGQVTGKFSGEVTTILGAPLQAEGVTLLAGISHYETGSSDEAPLRRFDTWAAGLEQTQAFPGEQSSVGPMALADIDGDGRLELFVGGRVIPGKYPEAAHSHIYRQENGKFALDQSHENVLAKVGLISGAVFSDLNGDGLAELALAGEWGPLKVFWNEKGTFSEATERLGLAKYQGWWNSVSAADFDGDGRLDLVAGNWGRNSQYQYYAHQPLKLFYGDVNGDGSVQVIEAHYEPPLGKYVPWRFWDTLSQAMPLVQERFASFKAFSTAGVDEVFGPRMDSLKSLSANTLDSMVFLNRGDRFEARPLPLEAQLSPVFGIVTGDLDGDGHEDVFLSQNFFGVAAEVSRYDAGLGLWLRGDGKGGFRAVPAAESGLRIYGEGRGAALCDYDGDGRVDLAAAQNGSTTKLYHNEQARPGLRIRLNGRAGNRSGIGAVVRWKADGKLGPARELHAGSGYWSQDSAIPVLAVPEGAVEIQVRWPGGANTTSAVPAGAKEASIDFTGKLQKLR